MKAASFGLLVLITFAFLSPAARAEGGFNCGGTWTYDINLASTDRYACKANGQLVASWRSCNDENICDNEQRILASCQARCERGEFGTLPAAPPAPAPAPEPAPAHADHNCGATWAYDIDAASTDRYACKANGRVVAGWKSCNADNICGSEAQINARCKARCEAGEFGDLPVAVAALEPVTDPAPTPDPAPEPAPVDLVSVMDFGAKGDGATDNTAALKNALAKAKADGKHGVSFPAGNFLFQPVGPSPGFYLPSNFTLKGAGAEATTLTVSAKTDGANYTSLFYIQNQDNVEIRDLGFKGNNKFIEEGANYGAAFNIILDKEFASEALGTPRDLTHIVIQNCKFDNFNAGVWVRVQNYSDAHKISDVQILDNEFVSQDSNAVAPENIGHQAAAIQLMGSLTSPAGVVTKAVISGNKMRIPNLKNGVTIFAGATEVKILKNEMYGVGYAGDIPNDKAAYAVLIYDNAYYWKDAGHQDGDPKGGLAPDNIYVDSNLIEGARSAGVYVADANHVYITGNKISGQLDPLDGTLPKGAIAMNRAFSAVISDNKISSSHIGITILSSKSGAITAKGNIVQGIPSGGFGAILRALKGYDGTLQFYENKLSTSQGSNGVTLKTENETGRLEMSNNVEERL